MGSPVSSKKKPGKINITALENNLVHAKKPKVKVKRKCSLIKKFEKPSDSNKKKSKKSSRENKKKSISKAKKSSAKNSPRTKKKPKIDINLKHTKKPKIGHRRRRSSGYKFDKSV